MKCIPQSSTSRFFVFISVFFCFFRFSAFFFVFCFLLQPRRCVCGTMSARRLSIQRFLHVDGTHNVQQRIDQSETRDRNRIFFVGVSLVDFLCLLLLAYLSLGLLTALCESMALGDSRHRHPCDNCVAPCRREVSDSLLGSPLPSFFQRRKFCSHV